MVRMCRCAGRVRLRGRLRAGVAVAASAVSRQEIETHLVKRAVGKYMHRLWVHQSALMSIDFGRGGARRRRERCCTAKPAAL